MDDKDRALAREVGPWGFAATAVAMIGIFFSRLASGIDVLQSVGYTFFALLLVPLTWMFAGRYASYWLTRGSRKQIVRSVFVVFWVLLTAKLFFLSERNQFPSEVYWSLQCALCFLGMLLHVRSNELRPARLRHFVTRVCRFGWRTPW